MIYLTSDLHLLHDKEFVYKARGYDNVLLMSIGLINNINKTVNENDTLYILGDLALNNMSVSYMLLSSIKCKHIHIILGNHDTDAKIEEYKKIKNVERIAVAERLKYGKYNFILSHYPMITSNVDDDKHINQRVYSLCGHTHTKDNMLEFKKGINAYHVEVDAHNNCPVSIETIIKDIRNFYLGGNNE